MEEAFQSWKSVTNEPQPADVAQLEAELSALWRSAAEHPGSQHAVIRSCSLTLLVYVESEKAGREVLKLIDRVAIQNPCRAVIMIAEPVLTPAGLSAQISARCHLPTASEREVCCEQVLVLARGEAVAGLDQVVIPLMVPELPVYLWWRASGFAPPPYLGLILRSADRVLVDSARFPDPEVDLPRLLDKIRMSHPTVFTDLNWGRLTAWREVVAECFDSPETRPCLDELEEVRIDYEQDSPRLPMYRAQSLLLVAWLASRLAWLPVPGSSRHEGEGRSFVFRGHERSVRVECTPRRFEGGGAGVCFSLTIKAGGACPATFSLRAGPDGKTALVHRKLSDRSMTERAVRLRISDEVELLNGEIRFARRDRIYEEALSMLAHLEARST